LAKPSPAFGSAQPQREIENSRIQLRRLLFFIS
jgi:hypothetical protein